MQPVTSQKCYFCSFSLRTLLNILPSPPAVAFVHTTLRRKKRIGRGSLQHLSQNEHVQLSLCLPGSPRRKRPSWRKSGICKRL